MNLTYTLIKFLYINFTSISEKMCIKKINLYSYTFKIVVVVLKFCSWVKSRRATLFDLSARSFHQRVLKQSVLFLVKSLTP